MKTMWKGYEIESKFVGEKNSNWDNDSTDRHHVITISNGRNELSFDFWTSKAQPEITDEKDLLEAVECFFMDAQSGYNDFYDFCNEMGYDVPRGAYESWQACKKAKLQAQSIFGSDFDELANELREEIWA